MVAHDIAKPFTMLKLILSQIKNGNQTLTSLDGLQVLLEKSIKYVENLLSDLLSMASSRPVRPEIFALQDIVVEAHGQVQSFSSKRVLIELDIQHEGAIEADRIGVMRLFINLFHNAHDAIEGQVVKIRVESKLVEVARWSGVSGGR